MELSNEQWSLIEALIPSPHRENDGGGRPRKNPRDVLNGIYGCCEQERPGKTFRHDMISPAPDLPPLVSRQGVFRQILIELGEDLYKRGAIDIRETFIDGSFSPAKKGVILSALRSVAKGRRLWQSETLLVFLSPLTYKSLHPTK